MAAAAIESAEAGSRGKGRKRARGEAAAASYVPSAASEAAEAARRGKEALVKAASPVTAAKAIKNPAEMAGMVEAHLRDAVALANTFAFFEAEVGFAIGFDLFFSGGGGPEEVAHANTFGSARLRQGLSVFLGFSIMGERGGREVRGQSLLSACVNE